MIKELAHSQSVEDQPVSFILKSSDVGISDGRASAFAKRDDQHVSFSNPRIPLGQVSWGQVV